MRDVSDAALTAEVQGWFRSLGAAVLALQVQVRWNGRMRSTAGKAWMERGLIELNPRLLGVEEAEVERTLRHEAAHLLAYWRARGRRIQSHGAEWRQACVDLAIPGERVTHTLPFPQRRVAKRYHYACPQCGLAVARVRRFRRPTACLACCRSYSGGRFDVRFQFQLVPQVPPLG